MDELHLLGVHEDGEHLLLASADDQQRFRLPLNDALRAAVRWERSNRAPGSPAADGEELRPRDVQAMIRAGATAQEAADRANWSVEKVRRYEGPILAERAYMATEAGRAHVRTRGGAVTLADRVAERLAVRGVSTESATWDSWRDEDGHWTVEIRFAAGGRQRSASWLFNKASMSVAARDDEARWLSEEEAEPEPVAQHVAPTRARVYDVEAEGGLRPARPETPVATGDEVTLMTAMRERSAARGRRRGPRKSPAASPTALPPLGESPPVKVPPLAELRYDPDTMPPPPAAHGEPDSDGIDGRPEPGVLADPEVTEGIVAGFDDDEPSTSIDEDEDPDTRPAVVFEDDDGEVLEAPTPLPLRAAAPTQAGSAVATPEPVAALPPQSVASDTVDEPELPLGADEPVNDPVNDPEDDPEDDPVDEVGAVESGDATVAGPSAQAKARGQRTQPSRAPRSRRKGRASVPAWDDIVFGAKPGADD